MQNSTDIGTPEQSPLSTIQRALKLLQALAQVFEIRVLGIPQNRGKPATAAGWFDNIEAACQALRKYVVQKAAGIYVTLNPVNPALLARTNNQFRDYCETTTGDKDIVRRVWLFLDFDPERADGISSSNDELAAALVIAARCRDWLRDQFNWPDPIEAMSGNGVHLVYRIDLPNDEAAKLLVQRILKGIAAVVKDWQTESEIQIKLDPVNFNASRIAKLWGSVARKGADTADRPHRQSDILRVPDQIEIIPVEKLEAVAALDLVTKPKGSNSAQPPPSPASNPDVVERARRYLAKLPPAVSGQAGHKQAFRTACVLMKDFALSLEDALPVFREWNQTCEPPWSDREILHKLEDAAKSPGPFGKLLQNAHPERRSATGKAKVEDKPTDPVAKPVEAEFLPFPIQCLPDPVRTFVVETANSMHCDPCFIILPLLAALAAAVGNSRRIRLKNTWTEPCILWTVIVGESGTMKSPALEAALAFIRHLQANAYVQFKKDLEQFDRDSLEHEAELESWKRSRKDGDGGPQPEKPVMPVCVRYHCSDTTVEALADILEGQPRGMLMTRDEFSGWLSSFDNYKSSKGGDVAQWLSMHRASELTVDRKTGRRLTYIPRAAVSMTGGIQPATMASALTGRYRPKKGEVQITSAREHFDNGLAARLLFAMPPRKAKSWTEQDVSLQIREIMQRLFNDLISLEMNTDENGTPCPVDLQFDPKAHKQWIRFYNEHAQEQVELTGDMAAAWSKLEGYAARFALLFHLIRYAANDPTLKDGNQIDERSLAAAIEVSRWFGEETSRIYATIGARSETDQQRERRELIRIIKSAGGRITSRELMRHCRRYRDRVNDADTALQTLVDAGLGVIQSRLTTRRGGRPTMEFVLTDLPAEAADTVVPDIDQGEVSSPSPDEADVPPKPSSSSDQDVDLDGLNLP